MLSINMKEHSRLPGVYFRTERPPPRETLPRMDIAAFVGFAEAGPQQIPVPIEDMDQFREIFGNKLDLAWDLETGQMHSAYLAPAVEAFFQNGGKRCWVVRAANNAQKNKYVIPNLIRTDNWQPETTQARSGGSWCDNFRVGCTLFQQPFIVKGSSFRKDTNEYHISLSASPARLKPGDLLRLTFGERIFYLGIDKVSFGASGQDVTCPMNRGYWFKSRYPENPPEGKVQGTAEIHRPGQMTFKDQCLIRLPQDWENDYIIEFTNQPEPLPRYGDILYITIEDEIENVLILPVTDTLLVAEGIAGDKNVFQIMGFNGLWLNKTANEEVENFIDVSPYADLLTFSLSVWQDQERIYNLDDLGFCQDHNRFWAQLPTDKTLFDREERKNINCAPGSLADEAAEPRFPLAGPENPDNVYIPIGMPFMPSPQHTTATLEEHSQDTRLERNGLKVFSSNLFLDEELKSVNSQRLPAEANYKKHQDQKVQLLIGLHSLWNIEEVTLISIPDAVQRGWQITQSDPPDLLNAPTLNVTECTQIENESDFSQKTEYKDYKFRRLVWNTVIGAKRYTIQEASNPDFTQSVTFHLESNTTISIPIGDPCSQTYFYRVRATSGAMVSPWSKCRMIICPETHFSDCITSPSLELSLELIETSDNSTTLGWKIIKNKLIKYFLQQAEDPAFISAAQVCPPLYDDLEKLSEETINDHPYGIYKVKSTENKIAYYRIRAMLDGQKGPWSNTVVIKPPMKHLWTMIETKDYHPDDLLMIQRAMLAFSAALGDKLSILTMPSHYRHIEVVDHLNFLQASFHSFTATLEERDLSFGALFHPWLITRTTSRYGIQKYQIIPPDGAICGMMAATALGEGAWIAPANIPIKDIVALKPHINRAEQLNMYLNQINLVSHDPGGFLVMGADTISTDPLLKSINVRRLINLLRRLALREGRTFIFEPNSASFRRRVKYHFEEFLENLFMRGALAGKSSDEAFNVVIDYSVNPQTGINQGRFVIELHIAPSQPLEFLIVQLVQQELSGLSVSEM